ncbi:unnamed protein product [Pelagomonas calceolata]|uniref:Fe2OG dioxygenase domain-containing protein n=2 Tax=Pelagomonas calceolata TaxID=35677 RepID=A0A8J2WUA4_9STRA|nr:unnamed protein product [Pelagomonas calceolata]
MRRRLATLVAIAARIAAWGEGPAPIQPPPADGVLAFEGTAADGFVEDCGTARAGRVVAAVRVALPEDAPEWRSPELCVAVSLRVSSEAAWWFVVPPEPDEPVVACASTESRDGDSVLVRASLVVEENVFVFVHAWLRQDPASTTRLATAATAAFATTEDAPVFAAAETLSNARLAAIVAAWDAARNDERAEHAAFRARASESQAFALEEMLAPELRDALRAGSPAALAPLLGGQGRVRTLQVLTRPAAEAVAAALDCARGTTESRPTNNMSYATSDVGVVVPRTADGPASLLVDEAGLGGLFDALAETVVAPLARLLFPAFPPMDSRHAFSVHKRSPDPHPTTNATASRHNDVCEISLNLCVRASDDLEGSRVAFFGIEDRWLAHEPGAAFLNVCRDQHGVEPVVRGMRDTVVLRLFASAHRRAPAEMYRERCLPPSVF